LRRRGCSRGGWQHTAPNDRNGMVLTEEPTSCSFTVSHKSAAPLR
jgi:hypothetical protein